MTLLFPLQADMIGTRPAAGKSKFASINIFKTGTATGEFPPPVWSWESLPILARISHQLSTAAADPGMSTALRSVGLLDQLSSTPAEPSVARLVPVPVCTASLRNLVKKAG